MTLFLASVRDADEAELALNAHADIIDLKDPGRGALGALAPETIAACVRQIDGRARLSATIGDLPMDGETVGSAARATAASGVDFVKLGLFPGGDPESCLDGLARHTPGTSLILVAFADALPAYDPILAAARIGAHGVMLDTMGKQEGSLLDHLPFEELARFVQAAKGEGLIVGLAGSLRAAHVPQLLRLDPHLLGFRGALCHGGSRNAPLDPASCAAIRALIPAACRARPMVQMPEPRAPALC